MHSELDSQSSMSVLYCEEYGSWVDLTAVEFSLEMAVSCYTAEYSSCFVNRLGILGHAELGKDCVFISTNALLQSSEI